MSNMIERVARAIYEADGDPSIPWALRRNKDEWFAIARAAIAARADYEPDTHDWNFLWKWVERGLYDPAVTEREALKVLAHFPAAPWNRGRWDVDHKVYAGALYKDFPKARAASAPLSTPSPIVEDR